MKLKSGKWREGGGLKGCGVDVIKNKLGWVLFLVFNALDTRKYALYKCIIKLGLNPVYYTG